MAYGDHGRQGDRNIWEAARIEQLCTHYQHTNELAHRLWERRNFQFVVLGATVALSAIITILETGLPDGLRGFLANQGVPAAADGDGKVAEAIAAAVAGLPPFLTVAVFYLMTNVYHRSVHITNYWRYVGRLEQEIRSAMAIHESDWAFSREGNYFRRTGERASRKIGSLYKWILLLLLAIFFLFRLGRDYTTAWSAVKPIMTETATEWNEALLISVGLPCFVLLFNTVMLFLTLRVYGAYAKWWWRDHDAGAEGYT